MTSGDGSPSPRWAWPLVAAVFVLAIAAAAVRSDPPTAAPENAAATEFSATRAIAVLTRVLGPSPQPHPIGTAANTEVRNRIVAELRGLGLSPVVEPGVSCRGSVCAWPHNIIATIEGQTSGPAVVLMSHYDSVPAGPGAGDDGSGVAITLEIARALLAGDPPPRPVILLIDDGEEIGLHGAQSFVDGDWAERVGVVVNVEARGSRGLSTMFETTGDHNGWLISALADGVPRPAMLSLAAAVYEVLPNDTDLSVFRKAGFPGVNFAFSDGVAHYHTQNDDLRHLDPDSVQHQGDSALGATRALAAVDLAAPPSGSVAYMDVLGLFVLRWPNQAIVPLALTLLLAVGVAVGWARRRGRVRLWPIAVSWLGLLVVIAASAAAGHGIASVVDTLGRAPTVFELHPLPQRVALWSVGGLAVVGVATIMKRARELVATVSVLWATITAAVALTMPAASNVLFVPAAVGLWPAWAVARGASESHVAVASAGFAATAAIVFAPLLLGFEVALGSAAAGLLAALFGLMATPCAPAIAMARPHRKQWRSTWAVGAIALVAGTIVALFVPAYSADHTQGLNLVAIRHRHEGVSSWLAVPRVGDLPSALADAGIDPARGQHLPWTRYPTFTSGEAELPAIPGVQIEVLHDSGGLPRTLELRLHSPRGSARAELLIPVEAELRQLMVDGRPSDPDQTAWRGPDGDAADHHRLMLAGLPAQGATIRMTLGAPGPVEVRTVDVAFGLPDHANAQALLDARPRWAAPFQFGDIDVVVDRHAL